MFYDFSEYCFTGLNLSHQQCEYMRHKMQDPESFLSSGRFTLHEGDLNEAQFTEKFLAVNNSLMAKQVEKGSKDDSNDH